MAEIDINNAIEDWPQLVELEKYLSKCSSGEWVFRGDSEDRYPTSTLERAFKSFDVKDDDKATIEKKIIMDFQSSCHVHAPAAVPDKDDIMAWLALMRHYGAPTRLVDFTYSLFIATYFAVESWEAKDTPQETRIAEDCPHKNKIPVVWAVNRSWLSKYLDDYVLMQGVDGATRGKMKVSWQSIDDHNAFNRLFYFREPKDVDFVAVLNTFKKNERILVQQGLFLAANDVEKPFYSVLKKMKDADDNVKKIKIVDCAHEILPRLYRAGVNRASLFPGLQGFSESLRPKILTYREADKVRKDSWNWLFPFRCSKWTFFRKKR